jgi:flagellar hook protein FlgE
VPRRRHAEFEPAPGRTDPVEVLERQAQSRVQELVPIRYGRMLVSPFTFYRGAAAIMAEDLASTPQSGLQVQCCGDAHLSNFGVFASPERRLVFDINDFDETLPGPWEWDVKRLAVSMLIAAQSNATATSSVTLASNLPASASVPTNAFSTSDSTSYNDAAPVTVYDSQGGSHQATIYYVKTATNSWDANLYVDGQSAGTQPLTFDSTGKLTAPTNGTLAFNAVNLGNGSSPLTLSLNVNNLTQYGTDYSAGSIIQNGFEAGTLSGIDIDQQGVVTATYSNNQSTQIGQVAIANFANVQGLRQLGDTTWAASTDSGPAIMGTASVGQFGAMQSGALESSNTADTTAQLVDMIQAQRNYQANAQVLSTDNTLASALFNAGAR